MRILPVSFIMVYAVYACTDEHMSQMIAEQQKHCKFICETCECEKARRCASGEETLGCRNRPVAAWKGCQTMCKGCLGSEKTQSTAVTPEPYVPENPADRFTCDRIRSIPVNVRSKFRLSSFYSKYTEAYGIPIVSTDSVPNKALSRVCYVTRFMLARRDIREVYVKRKGYVVVVADAKNIMDIPEFAYLRSDYTTPKPRFEFMKQFKPRPKFKYNGERGFLIEEHYHPSAIIEEEESMTCSKFLLHYLLLHLTLFTIQFLM